MSYPHESTHYHSVGMTAFVFFPTHFTVLISPSATSRYFVFVLALALSLSLADIVEYKGLFLRACSTCAESGHTFPLRFTPGNSPSFL